MPGEIHAHCLKGIDRRGRGTRARQREAAGGDHADPFALQLILADMQFIGKHAPSNRLGHWRATGIPAAYKKHGGPEQPFDDSLVINPRANDLVLPILHTHDR